MAAIRQALAQSQQEAETLRNRQSGADKARTDAEQTLQLLTENATFMQARLKELADENQRLNAERSAEAQQQAETAADIALPISNEAVTESEQKKFGGDTEAYVRKIVNLELSKVLAPILARVKELSVFRGDIGRRVESTEQATAAMARPMLKIIGKGFVEEEVLPHFPDFVTRRTSPEWKSFIQSTDHASGKTFGELLRDTMATQDALVARGIIGRFYLGHPSTATPTAPSGISTEPATSASGAGSTTPQMAPSGTVPAFAFSRYKNATAQYTKKQITQAQLQAIKGEFEIASAAGTVDYAR